MTWDGAAFPLVADFVGFELCTEDTERRGRSRRGREFRRRPNLSSDRRTGIDQQRLPRDQVRPFDETHHKLRHILRLADVLQRRRAALTGACRLEYLLAQPLPQ